MKLGQLNAAIDAAAKVRGRTKFGPINFEKGDLKRALREHFTGGRGQETGLRLDAEDCLAIDQGGAA